jgi:hypothetical protein
MHTLLKILFVALVLGACTPYTVLRSSGPPSALRGAQNMGLTFDFSQVMLGTETEADFVARKTPEEIEDLEQIKRGFAIGFRDELPRRAGGVGFAGTAVKGNDIITLTVAPMYMRLGKYTFMYNEATELAIRCRWSKAGVVLDEIESRVRVDPGPLQPAQIDRARYGARLLARFCGQYIKRAVR